MYISNLERRIGFGFSSVTSSTIDIFPPFSPRGLADTVERGAQKGGLVFA